MTRDALVGSTIAGYSLHEMIGEGGTSTVYRGDHGVHGPVAVKVLREKLRQDKTAVARFVREAQFGARVVHPSVVKTLEIGEVEGLHFLTIEWALGELLEKYVKRMAPLPKDEVAAIITQIAAAVHAAHAEGIIHRDLKPDNVMYDPESRQVKLLDFGIAITTDTTADERLTRAGFFVGTLMYVAPEALSGELVGPAADQYSLATIAYQLLTGVLPYGAKNQREMFALLLKEPPTPLNKAKPPLSYSTAVEAVVMKGLSKHPRDRYPDVQSFARELSGALAAPEPTPSEGLIGKVRKFFG